MLLAKNIEKWESSTFVHFYLTEATFSLFSLHCLPILAADFWFSGFMKLLVILLIATSFSGSKSLTMVHLKGFQMAFEYTKAELRNKYDLIVFTAHFALLQEDFLCVGVGDEVREWLFCNLTNSDNFSFCWQFTADDEKKPGSEMLPAGWKTENGVYSLKYRSSDDRLKLLFKGILAGEHFIISAVVSEIKLSFTKI